MIERIGRAALARVEGPVVNFLLALHLTPNRISWLGLGLAAGTAALIGLGHLQLGGIVFILASATDALDGLLARSTGRVTRFGSCLDSTLDRLGEVLVLGGLLVYLQQSGPLVLPNAWSIPLVYLTMGTSLAVSYVKARAEGLGLECKTGWMQRSERIVVLGLCMTLRVVDLALLPLALLLCVTIAQRLHHVARQEPAA